MQKNLTLQITYENCRRSLEFYMYTYLFMGNLPFLPSRHAWSIVYHVTYEIMIFIVPKAIGFQQFEKRKGMYILETLKIE